MQNRFSHRFHRLFWGYLIRALIEQRRAKGIKIYCHARAATPQKALDRIINNMKQYECWQEEYRNFIIAVTGDFDTVASWFDRGKLAAADP